MSELATTFPNAKMDSISQLVLGKALCNARLFSACRNDESGMYVSVTGSDPVQEVVPVMSKNKICDKQLAAVLMESELCARIT